MEAMQQGAVPIIAQGPTTGTHQFALDERSWFNQKNAYELARKMDWWLDHPAELDAMRGAYVNEMKKYSIDLSVQELMKMFRDACAAE
jgi:glycosyltransferase involved in cell wall biosynthesis